MVDFDELNRQTREWKNNQPVDFTRGCGLSPRELIAHRNNETYRANNGCYPARPYGPSGYTYNTGRSKD